MSAVVIAGDTSGSITLDAPAVAGTTVLTLPATTGTVFVGGQALTATTGSFSGNVTLGSSVLATPSGTAPSYTCRAWVNFNGTGTVAIRGSGNVTSITDNGTGDYTVNFTNAMPDANYNVVGASQIDTNAAYITSFGSDGLLSIKRGVASPLTTGSARIGTGSTNNSLVDNTINCVSIFR